MTDASLPALNAEGVSYAFPGGAPFLKQLDFRMQEGECWGIIGPNGAGKSTLLKILAGLLAPTRGNLELFGQPLEAMDRLARARRLAFLPQHVPADMALTAGEIVLMGRHPHHRFSLFESAADRAAADRALQITQTQTFASRSMQTLSGGEAQRVHIAAALAQEPSVLLLDEPTAALDLLHQLSIFELLRSLTRNSGLLVVVVTHDINLAARFCSHVLVLDGGVRVADGPPEQVMTPSVLEPVYNVELTTATAASENWVLPIRPAQPAVSDETDGQS